MSIRGVLRDARRGHGGLYGFGLVMAGSAVALVVAAVVDQRTLLGAPLWFKPLKFALSFALYAPALAWMISLLRRPGRTARGAGWVVVIASALEMAIIVGQAALGKRSHFNVDTAFDAALFSVMGATVVVLWLATAVIAVLVIRERGVDPAATAAVRAGLVVGLVGAGLGFALVANGGHSVGVPDGGPGLLFTGWSTTGGDLRIGHFVGMHALQLLPLLAALLGAIPVRRLDPRGRHDLVRIAAVAYSAAITLITWQALRGQPLLAPDTDTLAGVLVLVAGTTIAVGVALANNRQRNAPEPATTSGQPVH